MSTATQLLTPINMKIFHAKLITQVLLVLCVALYVAPPASSDWDGERRSTNWDNHGGSIYNRRHAKNEKKISPQTASILSLKWKFNAGLYVTATPAIHDGILYFPSANGSVYAVEASSGSLIWKIFLSEITNSPPLTFIKINATIARATPTVAGDILIIGIYFPSVVIGVNRFTGKVLWSTRLDQHPNSVITQSGTYYKGNYFVGVSSLEEVLGKDKCCTFRGSFCKMDATNGAVLWQTYLLPDNQGETDQYAGAAVWGSSPSIDVRRNHVYIATGNLYSVPESVAACQLSQNNQTTPAKPDACLGPDIHSESILALDMDSGAIKWSRQIGGYDVWTLWCSNPKTTCQLAGPNVDADFGEAPMMLTLKINSTMTDAVVAAQKSGFVWALNRDNGKLLWFTEAGPGGTLGGGIWGSATDGERVYTNIGNSQRRNFTERPSMRVTTSGGWVAMDADSGRILWSTANPSNGTSPGPVTVANGVLFAGSADPTGYVYAIDVKTGRVLWRFQTAASVYGGMSVADGCAYVGNGDYQFAQPTGKYLFAFCVD